MMATRAAASAGRAVKAAAAQACKRAEKGESSSHSPHLVAALPGNAALRPFSSAWQAVSKLVGKVLVAELVEVVLPVAAMSAMTALVRQQ